MAGVEQRKYGTANDPDWSEAVTPKSVLQREQSIATKSWATGLEGKAVRREEPAEYYRLFARALSGHSVTTQRLYDQRQRSVERCL